MCRNDLPPEAFSRPHGSGIRAKWLLWQLEKLAATGLGDEDPPKLRDVRRMAKAGMQSSPHVSN
jgi:hypothetical protein